MGRNERDSKRGRQGVGRWRGREDCNGKEGRPAGEKKMSITNWSINGLPV